MRILRNASAGTLESSDAAVTVEPLPSGIEIVVEGADVRFASRVREAAAAALAELGAEGAKVTVRDRSALDCTVRARVLAACLRACAQEPPGAGADPALPWEALR